MRKKTIRSFEKIVSINNIKPKLKVEYFLDVRKKNLYTSTASIGSKTVIFRVALSKEYNKSIQKEVKIYQRAASVEAEFMPKLIKFGNEGGHYWLMYEYIDGKLAGNVYQFNSSISSSIISKYFDDVKNFQKNMPKDVFKNHFEREGWISLTKLIASKNIELSSDKDVSSAIDKIMKAKDIPNSTDIVHGDLHPKNIIITGEGIRIIDWESSHYNSPFFDYSFTWIRSYRKATRKRIMKNFKNNYPNRLNEIPFVMTVNLLRDYFELDLVSRGDNILLDAKDLINDTTIRSLRNDLIKNIQYFSKQIQ